jgi:hypothetical protein
MCLNELYRMSDGGCSILHCPTQNSKSDWRSITSAQQQVHAPNYSNSCQYCCSIPGVFQVPKVVWCCKCMQAGSPVPGPVLGLWFLVILRQAQGHSAWPHHSR